MKKRIIASVLFIALIFTLCACTSDSSAASETAAEPETEAADDTTLINDNEYDVTEQQLIDETGMDLQLVGRADDIVYNVITPSTDPIAEAQFIVNGKNYYLRAKQVSITSIEADNAEYWDISGLYYEWISEDSAVSYCDASVQIGDDAGFIAWLDAVPGIIYNLCCAEKTTPEELVSAAEAVFVPMQGDSEGDEPVLDEAAEESLAAVLQAIKDVAPGSAGSSLRTYAAGCMLLDFAETWGGSADASALSAFCHSWYEENLTEEEKADMFVPSYADVKEFAMMYGSDPASYKDMTADCGYECMFETYELDNLEYVCNYIEIGMADGE